PLERGGVGGTATDEVDDASEAEAVDRLDDLRAKRKCFPGGVGQPGKPILPWRRTEGDGQLGQPNYRRGVAGRVDGRLLLRHGVDDARTVQRRTIARYG